MPVPYQAIEIYCKIPLDKRKGSVYNEGADLTCWHGKGRSALKRFPKLRPGVWDGVTAAFIFLLAFLSALVFWRPIQAKGLTAAVLIDGAEADRIALDRADMSETREYSGRGYTVRVQFQSGGESGVSRDTSGVSGGETGVQVVWADCPTQDCVHTGRISRHGQAIICLPARIVIRLEGGAAPDASLPDAVLG